MMSCSIILCTRNRCASLRRTLAALEAVGVPDGWTVEVIVADNGSTDETARVVEAAQLPNMACRYVCEPRVGQCYARNAGLAAAAGEIIIFTDDDVVPARDWLAQLCSPVVAGRADAVAGTIVLAANLVRPWMTPMHRAWLASSEWVAAGQEPRLIGANMAFARRVLERVPGFDVELGPGRLGFGDDDLFGEQLRAAGYRIIAQPSAVVEHHFDPARLTRDSFLSSARKQGRTMAYLDHHWHGRTLRFPRLRLAYATARLVAWRACRPAQLFRREGMEPAEMYHVQHVSYCFQTLAERTRRRAYGVARAAAMQSSSAAGPVCA
jgi:glucosyl-dolichyl phosphate glucuronosyltransferase